MKKTIIAVLILLVLILGGVAFLSNNEKGDADLGFNQSENDNSVAVVNGETISRADFETAKTSMAMQQGIDFESLDVEAQQEMESQVLESLISQVLLRQAADAEGETVPEEDVQAQMEVVKSQFESEEVFQQTLETEGFTEEELESQIRSELVTNAYLQQQIDFDSIEVTEAEVEETYAQVTAGQEAPELSELYEQIEQIVAQEKSQGLVSELIAELRAGAEVESLL